MITNIKATDIAIGIVMAQFFTVCLKVTCEMAFYLASSIGLGTPIALIGIGLGCALFMYLLLKTFNWI